MRIFLNILPVALLVTYSQVIVKWRMNQLSLQGIAPASGAGDRLLSYLTDPYILSAYLSALVGSFAWLFLVSKYPLTLAFPIYQSLIFILVALSGVCLLGETLTPARVLAIILIMIGMMLIGSNA